MEFRLLKEEELVKTPYLTLKNKRFSYSRTKTETAKSGDWSFVERNHKTNAVIIIPYIRQTDEFVLIKQFRIPLWKHIIEFPAGLIERGESVESAAKRELEEETGLTGQLTFQSPWLAVSSGLTTEMLSYCIIEVNDTHKSPQNLDPIESIEVFRVPRVEFYSFCSYMVKNEDCIVDCKVYLCSGILQSVLEEPLCRK